MFSTRKQSVPERFLQKMRVDAAINDVLKDKVVAFSDIHAIKEKLKPLREEQQALRTSCEAFIRDQKARGPTA